MATTKIKHGDSRVRLRAKDLAALEHASRLILRVCGIAGSPMLIDDAGEWLAAEGIRAAIRSRNTAALFDWLVSALSHLGSQPGSDSYLFP